jgi:acylphosphatase
MKLRLVVRGRRVQEVGYRLFLLSRAKGLKGFEAFNQDQNLVVLVEGGEEAVRAFLAVARRERPPAAEVSEVVAEPYEGLVMDIGEYRSQFSLEQLAKMATVGVEMRDDIKEMKGDVKSMLGKQDETIQEIRELRGDLKAYMEERFRRLERDVEMIKAKLGLQ